MKEWIIPIITIGLSVIGGLASAGFVFAKLSFDGGKIVQELASIGKRMDEIKELIMAHHIETNQKVEAVHGRINHLEGIVNAQGERIATIEGVCDVRHKGD